jgi:hypothetical protein
MADVVEGGTDRRTGRLWGAVAACAVVALGAVALTSRDTRHAAPRTGPSPISQAEFGDPLLDDGYDVPGPLSDLPRWSGPLPSLLAAEDGALVRRANGAAEPLPVGDPSDVLGVPGGNVVVSSGPDPASPGPAWFVPSGGAPVRIGTGQRVAPALGPGTVWLTTWRVVGDATYVTARLVALDGSGVRRTVRLPRGTDLAAETPRGLWLVPDGSSYVWDPVTRRKVADLRGNVFRWSSGRWGVRASPGCTGDTCHAIVDMHDGTSRPLPGFDDGAMPAVSPDGRWAVSWVRSGEATSRLRAVDLTTGNAFVVRGSEIGVQYPDRPPEWSADSRLVLLRAYDERGQVVVGWAPGTGAFGVVLDTSAMWAVAE